ncbi:MAG TPA: cytochrome c peroxidase [Polyangia bacterium]|nr:cytochrome c peroxidase [Polyangia bacterium]
MSRQIRAASAAGLACLVAAAVSGSGCGKGWGSRCASPDDCFFSGDEWGRVRSLADVTKAPPPGDPSNGLLDPASWDAVRAAKEAAELPPAVRLGWRLYHDPRLSGDGSDPRDSLGVAQPSAPRKYDPASPQLRIACVDCHDPAKYGSDYTSQPPNVSNGAGFYDVNTQQTLNVARLAPVFYWNGRADSLWAQAAQVMESPVSMASRREKTLWVVANCYLGDADAQATWGSLVAADGDVAKVRDLMKVASPATAKTAEFRAAYDDARSAHPEIPASLATRVHVEVAKAIAAYEWFLSSDRSRFDAFVAAGPASPLLSASEKRGLKLFVGRAGCMNCHNTSMFSDGQFHDVGVAQAGEHVPTVPACTTTGCECRVAESDGADGGAPALAFPETGAGVGGACLPAGAYAGVQKVHAAPPAAADAAVPTTTAFRRCTCFDDDYRAAHEDECADGGAGEAHGCEEQGPATYGDAGVARPPVRWLGAWRTPSLRDVAMTGPYMHDGAIATLEDVVWHYDQATAGAGWGTPEISPLLLSDQDRADLVAFLKTLTGVPGPPALVSRPDPESYPPACAPGDLDAGADASLAADGPPDAPEESGGAMADGDAGDGGAP